MATRVEWQCDGCDETEMTKNSLPPDWRHITVAVDGFRGYPVSEASNGQKEYDLCPRCVRHLADAANPIRWPRVSTSPTQDARVKRRLALAAANGETPATGDAS